MDPSLLEPMVGTCRWWLRMWKLKNQGKKLMKRRQADVYVVFFFESMAFKALLNMQPVCVHVIHIDIR